MEFDEVDMIDRLLEQGNEISLLEPQFETWAAELRERKGTLADGDASIGGDKAASTSWGQRRRKRSNKKQHKRSSMQFPGRFAGTVLPAWITDSARWQERMAEKGRRRRLANMKSTFERFPEVRKHLYKRAAGRYDSHKPRKSIQGERLRTQAWNTERLRKQLHKSAKQVLHYCSDDYIRKTHITQFQIELNRAAMSSKVTLHRLVPSSSQDELAGIDRHNGFQEMADIMAGEKSPQTARRRRHERSNVGSPKLPTSPPPASPSENLQDQISRHLQQKSSQEKEAMLAALLDNAVP